MTSTYLRNTTADYITGAVSAAEGIKDSLVLLNGPLGCRFYHGYASGQSILKSSELWQLRGELRLADAMEDSLQRSQYFAGTPQIPGSNLRYEDYIFGTREQLQRALNDIFSERKYSVFTVIQTPGTSLLGENLEEELLVISEEFQIPYLFVESPGLSEDFCRGYDSTTVEMMKKLLPHRRERKKLDKTQKFSIAVFGLHTYEKYLEGGMDELRRLFMLCGIKIECMAGANCTLEEFQNIPFYDACVFLSRERCSLTAEYLKENYDVAILDFGCMPIGPDLTEKLIREICSLLGADASAALEYIERTRAKLFYYIARYLGSEGFAKELRYAIEGEYSLVTAFVDYFSAYLGIQPVCVHPLYTECIQGKKHLEETLQKLRISDAMHYDLMQVKDAIVIGGANTILYLTAYSRNIFGIEIANPSSGYLHIVPKTILGCSGALFLLEQLLNGERLIKAGKECRSYCTSELKREQEAGINAVYRGN